MNTILMGGIIAAGPVLFILGLWMGKRQGVAQQSRLDRKEMERDFALRMNADFDFANLRSKAEQIVKLANEIGMKSKTAQDMMSAWSGGAPAAAVTTVFAEKVEEPVEAAHKAPADETVDAVVAVSA